MYNISLKLGNKTFSSSIDGKDLTHEQIQEKGWAIFYDAVAISSKNEVKGKDRLPEIQYEEILEPVVEPEPKQEVEKVYEVTDLTSLSREQLIEQLVISEQKVKDITQAISERDKEEVESIKKKLKPEKKEGEDRGR